MEMTPRERHKEQPEKQAYGRRLHYFISLIFLWSFMLRWAVVVPSNFLDSMIALFAFWGGSLQREIALFACKQPEEQESSLYWAITNLISSMAAHLCLLSYGHRMLNQFFWDKMCSTKCSVVLINDPMHHEPWSSPTFRITLWITLLIQLQYESYDICRWGGKS